MCAGHAPLLKRGAMTFSVSALRPAWACGGVSGCFRVSPLRRHRPGEPLTLKGAPPGQLPGSVPAALVLSSPQGVHCP